MPTRKFRLTASAVVAHFKHRCDRRFRWSVVAQPDRDKPGIGWNVPARVRPHSRPGIALLLEAGDSFELERLRALEDELAAGPPVPGVAPQVYHAGVRPEGARVGVTPTPLAEALQRFQLPLPPRFVAQVEIDLAAHPAIQERFLRRFGLDPDSIEMGLSRPDLIELLPPDAAHPLPRLRVWDFKASQTPRHEHFIQVAFYGLLLEAALDALGAHNLAVDQSLGVIEARQGRQWFELAPYALALDDFLRNRAPALLATPAADAHFHVQEACALCQYLDECRTRADAAFDLSRIPYISSESKRHLRAAGLRAHPELAVLDPARDREAIARLRGLSHDLGTHLPRYIAAAQALSDGEPRVLDQRSFQMPAFEDVRIVVCAEQDAVTGTCFALGLKIVAGWDEATNRPLGQEHVFIARARGDEASILLPFLQTLNRCLEAVDAANAAVRAQPVEDDPRVSAADTALAAATHTLDQFKLRHAEALRKRNPAAEALRAQRAVLEEALKQAKAGVKEARASVVREQRRAQQRLQFYLYDSLDLLALKGMVERHLFASEPPELLAELVSLVRLFPPESVLPDAETFRTMPATVLVPMLRALVALPIPYGYDLRSVSERYQPASGGFVFRPAYGFGWEHSNQVAFERIHDVWNGEAFTFHQRGTERTLEPEAVLAEIDKTVRAKLRATDAVIRRLKADLAGRLLLQKEPFRLAPAAEALPVQLLEALRVFTALEVAHDELETKRAHTLAVDDRVAGFVCIGGMRALDITLDSEGALWFSFDPAAADATFEVGAFNLALTPADDPSVLLSAIDGELFGTHSNRYRFAPYKVTLLAYDLQAVPPRVRLRPDNPAQFMKLFDPARTYVLDRLFVDYNSHKLFDVLRRVAVADGPVAHLQALIATGGVRDWLPVVGDCDALERDLRALISAAGSDPERLLNAGQWRAWRGVLRAPLTLLWGPPGTGKTHTLAHMLVGYALAARRQGRPLRLLVTAFTHHAIDNVLRKLADLAARYGLNAELLQIGKLLRNAGLAEVDELPAGVLPLDTDSFAGTLGSAVPCQVVGGTVWALYRAMQQAGEVVQPWFDVVLVDEASQLKLPDALIAFAASKPNANRILAGDDRQLPPIIRGVYPEQHRHMLGSVFGFVRQLIAAQPGLEEGMLFQLEANFRMNEPLTAYPRTMIYGGRFFATRPTIRIATTAPLPEESDDLVDFLLHPDRPVLLVRYTPSRSFTARNQLEAALATGILARLRELLVDPATGERYAPPALSAEGAAILAPHRAQNSAIRQLLRAVGFGAQDQPMPLVDTVDKLQGQERDVVIVSYGVADSEYAEGEAEFLLSSNRFNVAATRARHKLIVLCADTVLDLVPSDQRVLLDAMLLKEFRRYCDSGRRSMVWTTPDGQRVLFQVQWKGFPR